MLLSLNRGPVIIKRSYNYISRDLIPIFTRNITIKDRKVAK